MLKSVYCICIFIERIIDIKLMCESEPMILSLVIILLPLIILLLLYLLFQKICLWELTKLVQVFTRQTILRFYLKQSGATRHPSQSNGRNYRVRHIFCRRTPPPPKLNLPLINFGVINFLWISARPPSRRQWYHRLNELEVTFLEILQKFDCCGEIGQNFSMQHTASEFSGHVSIFTNFSQHISKNYVQSKICHREYLFISRDFYCAPW